MNGPESFSELSAYGTWTSMAGRTRDIRLAGSIILAAASKISALALQVFALPVALSVLGTRNYAVFLSLQASFGWFGLLALGLTIALPRFLSAAFIAGDKREQSRLFQTAFAMLLLTSGLLALCAVGVEYFVAPLKLIGFPSNGRSAGIGIAFTIGVLISCLRIVTSIVPAVRSGYQELHRVFAMTTLANLFVIVFGIALFRHIGEIWMMFVVLYVPIILLLLLDLFFILRKRPFLLTAGVKLIETGRKLLPSSLNAVLKQISYFLMTSGAMIAVYHLQSVRGTAAFGSLMAILILGASGFGAVYQPLLAAIANARSHRDWNWFYRAYIGGLILTLAVTTVFAAICGIAGPWISVHWLGTDLGFSRALCGALGLYFMFWMLSDYHFFVLAGIGQLEGLGKIFVLEGILALTLGVAFSLSYGIDGMAIGLAIGTASFSALYLPLRAWRAIRRATW